ncbi:MAG: SDR family NAD(P)-dependent oxidoreductase [Bacteroidota bacterium]
MSKKVWLITGCSKGLGRALAEAVLAAGNQLVATARNPELLKDLIVCYGHQVHTIALDVTDEKAAAHVIKTTIDVFGKLDVLVNNAGYCTINSIEESSIADFRAEIETNLFGTIIVTKAALPYMRKQKTGHIIQVSSMGGLLGPVGHGPYTAAKWGVEGFSEVLEKETKLLGIKVTILQPGGFRTNLTGISSTGPDRLPAYEPTVGAAARIQHAYHGKEPGDPAKAAAAILFLANLEEPPLRLLLGSDAVYAAEKNELFKIAADHKWRQLSISTDFDPSVP